MWKRKLITIPLIILLTLAVLGSGGSYWLLKRSLPATAGEWNIQGVQDQAEILRDEYGIPHIYAQNENDLFFAQGYTHAQDRMWQMEMSRRLVEGRLAEIIGADVLPQDRFHRSLEFKSYAEKSAAQLDSETKQILQAYADGVNAYLQDAVLPLEYTLVGATAEPWEITDSVMISKYMAWYLGGNTSVELFLNAVSHKVGVEKALSLVPEAADDPAILAAAKQQPLAKISQDDSSELMGLLYQSRGNTSPGEGVGSNNWVISGQKSASGKPLLADDMHLSIGAPSTFYQNRLSAPGYNVTGAIFPGVPGVIVGHNDHIAWGFTNLGPDVQDLYIEKQNPDNPHEFEYNGKWEKATVRKHEIKVKGQADPVIIESVTTRHGPLINGVLPQAGTTTKVEDKLALKWTASEGTSEIAAALKFGKSKNWSEFEQALRLFAAPAQNVVYADVNGTIAYRANGHIPIRKNGHGLLPVPGWTDDYEWESYIPWDELPTVINPAEGYIATANNKVIDDTYKHHITHEWFESYRVNRIKQMIEEQDKLTIEDMQRMQNDWHNLQAEAMRDVWLPILEKQNWTPAEQQALDTLKSWMQNPVDAPDLAGPAIYHAVLNKTMERVFAPQIGDDLYMDFLITGLSTNALDAILLTDDHKWFQGTGDSREKALIDGFKAGIQMLEEHLGDNQADWQWGQIHTVVLAHPMGGIPGLNLLLNDGPYPYGGSHVTVGAAAYSKKLRPYESRIAAPWRFTVDLSDMNNAQDAMIMGASGQPGSKHYNDQTELWLNGEYKTMYFTREQLKENTENVMVLQGK